MKHKEIENDTTIGIRNAKMGNGEYVIAF
ncbi:BnaA03g17590D [Brassica napus]|uniref:BnaA03g17590D protein n=1 Tax=Brassica napus TaxID=3708 RepID=A0A078F3U4_BRANA|nr:BnaA03g17590D [Brassica napus]